MSGFAPQSSDAAAVATIRTLAADVVGKANSGHPGAYACLNDDEITLSSPAYMQVHPWAWLPPLTSSSRGMLCFWHRGSLGADPRAGFSTLTPRAQNGSTVIDLSCPTGTIILGS